MNKTIYNSDLTEMYQYIEDNAQEIFEKEPTEDEIWEKAAEMVDMEYEDMRSLLNKKYDYNIICFADLGLWNGRREAHKILGHNLNECLKGFIQGDTNLHVYVDRYNLCADESHHDGTNHYTFKVLKNDISNLEEASYNMLKKNSRSLRKDVKEIFGW